MLSAKWRPFCLGLNLLRYGWVITSHSFTWMLLLIQAYLISADTVQIVYLNFAFHFVTTEIMATKIWVNFGSGDGLLPNGTKPLNEPIWTSHQGEKLSSVASIHNLIQHWLINIHLQNVWIWENTDHVIIPLLVRNGPLNNILALVQIMAWHQPCNKPLSEPMMVSSLNQMHICITQLSWRTLREKIRIMKFESEINIKPPSSSPPL